MAPSTITTIVMILFALGVFVLTGYAWLGTWNLVLSRPSPLADGDEIEAAVLQMRRAIEEYERNQH